MPREIGRPADVPTPFARGTKAIAPETKAVLKGLWCSGKFADKTELAESAGFDYDTLRHLASREGWPTEAELKKEISDAAVAAVRAIRNRELEAFVNRTLIRHSKVEQMIDKAIERFETDGALVHLDARTGEQHLSKHRVKDLYDIVKMSRDHAKAVTELLDIGKPPEGKVASVTARNSLIQLNHITKQ